MTLLPWTIDVQVLPIACDAIPGKAGPSFWRRSGVECFTIRLLAIGRLCIERAFWEWDR